MQQQKLKHNHAIDVLDFFDITNPAAPKFNPKATTTRGHFATFLYKTIALDEAALQLRIVSVTALDDTNRFLEINFSKSVSGLETSDISVQNADTLSRYGVKEVKLSNSGKTATVELFSHENSGVILEYLQNYTVKVNADGELLEATFNRPDYTKNRILDVNHADRQFTIVNRSGREVTINVPKTVEFDFFNALGSEARVWFRQRPRSCRC